MTLAAVTLTMAVVTGVGLISVVAVRHQIAVSVNADLEAEARLVEQQLRHDLVAIARDLDDMANNSFIANGLVDSEGRDTYLRPFLLEHRPPVAVGLTVSLLDFKGSQIATNAADSGRQRPGPAGVTEAIGRGAPQAGLSRDSGTVLLYIAIPVIFPPTGQPEGVLLGKVNLEEVFAASARTMRSEDRAELMVGGESLSGTKGGRDSGFTRIERRLDLPAPLESLSLTLVLARDRGPMLAAMWWVALASVLIGLATLVLVFTLARLTTRRLLLPLATLSQKVGEIAAGGSLAAVAKVSGQDEVGTLAAAFNDMIEKLRVAHDRLESQVEERTVDLARSEQRLLLHVQQTPLAAVEWDNDGRIVRWNPAAERLFGYPAEEAIGQTMALILPGSGGLDAQRVWREMRAQRGGSTREERHVTKQGGTILCEWYTTPLTLADGEIAGFASLAQDITERRQVELITGIQRDLSTLLSSTSSLEGALAQVLDAGCRIEGIDSGGVYLVDPKTGAIALAAHRGLSQAFVSKVAGYEADTTIARLVMAARTVCRDFADQRRSGSPASLEEGLRSVAFIPIEHEQKVIACLVLASHTADAISADTCGVIEAIAAQTGGTLARLRAEADLELSRKKLEELNQNLEGRVEQEIRLRLEKERLLVQQSRLAAMGEMIGAIAHQWRQPLNSVAAVIQDLGDAQAFGALDKPYLDRGVESAMRQIRFMSKTIDDFRNFFQPEKEKRLFDVKQAAAEVLTMLFSQLVANRICCSIVCAVHGLRFTDFSGPIRACGEMLLLGYENEMKQVYLNLVANAKDAILEQRARGLASPEEQGMITLEFSRDGERITITVTDNGGGIPEDVLERLFEPYYTTKEQGRGTGIGLYMSKMIIEGNMGGRITARNVAAGAQFTIEV
jgi:PAS domain S-box-containing protein